MSDRIHSVDSMRIIAMAFVVMIHTDPFRGLGVYGNMVNFTIDSTARFAVPFFFVTSGYLFARKTADRDPTAYLVKQATTIASLYAFGLALAAPVFLAGTVTRDGGENSDLVGSSLSELVRFLSPLELLYYGNSVSVILWFLPALAFSLTLVYCFVRADKTAYVVPVSLCFHAIGLLGASYTMFVDVPFEVRDALFFGFFYTSLGYYVGSRDWRPKPDRSGVYLGATALFAALHVGERYVLGYVIAGETFANGVYTASYTIGTALVSISLFAFLLSRPALGKGTPVPTWGRYAVGIYVTHPTVLFLLERTEEILHAMGYEIGTTLLWHLALTPATFFGALLVYVAARKSGVIRERRIRLPRLRSDRSHDPN
ncbi:acyltransferase [Halosolutus amylolyticus]|uniref:Acyltransferase n=1 Tax=Halosolutus amylolyticus TaxID=2932267 RepID=A0ABD5PV74_9EURY|nr:acyltransferase [Halosolutus amylolyticus]